MDASNYVRVPAIEAVSSNQMAALQANNQHRQLLEQYVFC